MESFQLVDMTQEHIPQLLDIEILCFSRPWMRPTLKALLQDPRSHFVVAVDEDGIVAGWAGVRLILDEANLDNIAVHPRFQGQGLGRRLLEYLIHWVKKQGASALLLEVRESNATAIRLYQRLGFVRVGRRENYYTYPTEAAALYTLFLTP